MTGQLEGKWFSNGCCKRALNCLGIAKSMSNEGAELAFTYQGEAFGSRLEPLASSIGSNLLFELDVADDASFENTFESLSEHWGKLDS